MYDQQLDVNHMSVPKKLPCSELCKHHCRRGDRIITMYRFSSKHIYRAKRNLISAASIFPARTGARCSQASLSFILVSYLVPTHRAYTYTLIKRGGCKKVQASNWGISCCGRGNEGEERRYDFKEKQQRRFHTARSFLRRF